MGKAYVSTLSELLGLFKEWALGTDDRRLDLVHLKKSKYVLQGKAQSNLKGVPYPVMIFRNLDDAYQWFDEP